MTSRASWSDVKPIAYAEERVKPHPEYDTQGLCSWLLLTECVLPVGTKGLILPQQLPNQCFTAPDTLQYQKTRVVNSFPDGTGPFGDIAD